ncbi:MAG: tRNA epoxyqueuosine(34) reductase QueG [Burkholderiaceae bacterium]|nr:tRNA epoxyqueuosine(34) reductase QueG [Burkholderiaceae bacterium]
MTAGCSPQTPPALDAAEGQALLARLRTWAEALGFSQIGVADVQLGEAVEEGLQRWLDAGWHGEMAYMAAHGLTRARPAALRPGTLRVITARMDYLPECTPEDWRAREQARLADPRQAVISLYARGRDYHKVLRQRLQRLAGQLQAEVGPLGHRVFCDSAPVLEVELAQRSALGWRGKHTLLLDRDGGSMSFLGEIFVDLPLPLTGPPPPSHCGRCSACLDACPTGAIVAPYRLDARRCISYLTLEQDGPIPPELRVAMGNRIYGCDDCQLACPWNKFARRSPLPDFTPRPELEDTTPIALWGWDEATFLRRTEGSPIRRIGHRRWLRNLAVALGNAWRATGDLAYAAALQARRDGADAQLAEHIDWALAQRETPAPAQGGAAGSFSAAGRTG